MSKFGRAQREQLLRVQYRGLISSIRLDPDESDTLDEQALLDMFVTRFKIFQADVDYALSESASTMGTASDEEAEMKD